MKTYKLNPEADIFEITTPHIPMSEFVKICDNWEYASEYENKFNNDEMKFEPLDEAELKEAKQEFLQNTSICLQFRKQHDDADGTGEVLFNYEDKISNEPTSREDAGEWIANLQQLFDLLEKEVISFYELIENEENVAFNLYSEKTPFIIETEQIHFSWKYKNAVISSVAIYEGLDNFELFYIHPHTGSRCQQANQVLTGWSEPNEADQLEWSTLIEKIQDFNCDLYELISDDSVLDLENY